MRKRSLARILLLAMLALSSSAIAQTIDCAASEKAGLKAGEKPSSVITQLAPLCYGVSEDSDALAVEIRKSFAQQGATIADHESAARLLAERVAQNSALYTPQQAREELLESLNEMTAAIHAVDPPGSLHVAPVTWKFDRWEKLPTVPSLRLTQSLDAACTTVQSKPCSDAMNTAKAWIRAAQLAESLLTSYSAPALKAITQRSKLRLARWHAYRDEGLPQFQWEWLINSRRLENSDDRERDANGQPKGPREPPSNQLILLHPGVGVEWRDAVENGEKANPAVYLEVLGINRWSWQQDSAEMRASSGISLIATYADREHGSKVGYGLMLHWKSSKPLALAFTRAGGDTSVVLNIDLAEYLKEQMSYWQGVGDLMKQENATTP